VALSIFDRLARRAFKQLPAPLLGRRWPTSSFDVLDVAFLKSACESAEYYEAHMRKATTFATDLDLLKHAMSLARPDGLFLEFGVAGGHTIRCIAGHHAGTVYGFDSFEGLPEDWRTNYPKGVFADQKPRGLPANVSLIVGWFSETLPDFVKSINAPISFMHIDCDLYSSARCIFDNLKRHIAPGCVIVFDEYFNYPGWREDEFRAFHEFLDETGLSYRYVGFVPSHQQVCVVLGA